MRAPLFGPIYCESPDFVLGFPAEPVNTFSNTAILFGIAAFFLVIRRAPRAYDLYLLCFLLFANGIGSFLWHGTRERWALTMDVWPGIVFVMVMVFLWARRIAPLWISVPIVVGFYYATEYLRTLSFFSFGGGWGRWTSMAPAVILVGAGLVTRSYFYSKPAALWGLTAIASALTGLTFRILDMRACDVIPFGTHFLWHIFLSTGAFLGIVTLILLEEAASRGRMRNESAVPAIAE